MAELASLALLDDRAVDRAGLGSVTYLLHQRHRYEYDGPVRDLRHRLMVLPRADHGGQRRVDHDLAVGGCRARTTVRSDRFGNTVVEVRADTVPAAVEFESWAMVRRVGAGGSVTVAASALADPRLLRPTPLTRADGALSGVARELAGPGGPLGFAERVCTWTRSAMAYQWGVTSVRTTAVEALAGGVGVCQDYAHVMLAVCRAAGVPARYVSGHLVGEGGSHAWVEVVVPDPDAGPELPGAAVAVAFDPTHDRRAGWGYVTVAVGRDYTDVAPTSGCYEGAAAGRLTGSKRLGVVATEPLSGLVPA
jgi:transglutaminase-like putative cysteine protease